MNFNEENLKAKWQDIKGDVQKAWSKITSADFEKTKGEFKDISELVQKNYTDDKERIQNKISDIMDNFKSEKVSMTEEPKKH